jgi:hypothetical protein
MKIEHFYGIDGDTITITQPTDIYVLLDWCQSRMIEEGQEATGSVNKAKWAKASDFLDGLMTQAEEAGFGSHEDIDNIEY